MAFLEVTGLKKYFRITRKAVLKAVDGVSFSIEKGRTLGLVGESGCGKTTVGRTLLRLYRADAGKVLLDGIDVHGTNRREYKRLTPRMQMIFQDPYASLNPRFVVSDIVGEGMEIHGLGGSRKDRQERVYELLELVGLNREHAARFPHEFSGGQRQRIGIARALALNPDFIVCDEAISALDVSIQAQIINLLVKLQQEMGLTYLFIAHDLSMVRHISDDTAVMYLGMLVETGETEQLFRNPLHPYTQGLLTSVPTADPDYEKQRRRVLIAGDVPSPVNPAPGCRFCKRCPKSIQLWSEESPLLQDVGGGHMVACHNL